MKLLKNIALTGLLTIGAFSAVTYTSCSKSDKTTDYAAKYLGTWNVAEPACGGNYTNSITAGTTENTIMFSNLGNFSSAATVMATAENNSLLIANYTDGTGRKFNGTGTYADSAFSVTYVVTYTDTTSETCTASFSK